MSEDEKNCNNCQHSYMECEHFRLRQKCRSAEYNSPNYTHDMLMEDWGRGYCRFWAPTYRKDKHHE